MYAPFVTSQWIDIAHKDVVVHSLLEKWRKSKIGSDIEDKAEAAVRWSQIAKLIPSMGRSALFDITNVQFAKGGASKQQQT